jgi:hypothetical protein
MTRYYSAPIVREINPPRPTRSAPPDVAPGSARHGDPDVTSGRARPSADAAPAHGNRSAN